ncbi:uncharacterized protein EDB91DRAFT_1246963 [Suillus paluster]|uniref:uncharacterized protein n=1 Tax=Suillus paluster TaxID=48578 RepID=UPI001B88131A|nr:uncharacterized protein EDB91DRAFT_1246963 [Suillus paluster]KAG1744082.1 hypothetical protein EDB91DRAFT_1246963 [Suillus paluster]
MAVRCPKPRRHKVSTLEAASAMQEELPPNTIVYEPWMNKAWQHPRKTRKLDLYLPGPPPVLIMPGRQHLTQQSLSLPSAPRTVTPQDHDGPTNPFSNSLHFFNDPSVCHLTSSQKKTNQWRRWSEEVIPSLIPHGDTVACHAGCETRSIKVAYVFFDSLSEINIIVCPCFPAPLQLLRRGLFPCAPVAPSLAVDLHVLEFVHLLFIRQSPNHTVWCDAVETYLDGMGYKLTLMHSLHHRFANAFHWYRVLTILARDHISNLIANTWKDKICLQPMAVGQPTEYLCSRYPLCFGANDWQKVKDWQKAKDSCFMPDIIICIDACFTQKCSTNPCGADGHDTPNLTLSFFLPKDNVQAMDEFMQHCRGERRRERASRTEPEEDCYEKGMSVPVSVLDGCRESFMAADKKREKASSRFFTDTGLMALLCRHDHVLWIVNLTLAGEKQHYSLTLLDRLFKHLPPQMTIGLLYDIGCQLERSCHKWNLLDESILFGLVKLSTIPGNAKQLIPPLHVSGFNQHLFVLDTQIHHLDMRLLQGFGHWLHWRWIHCQTKKNAALENLQDLDLDEDMLHAEWKAQIVHQTRPAPSPPFAIPPHSIPHDGIFQLDVDDNIWQDIGLENITINPLAWLSDEAVRNGIRLQLAVDRCFKEEARLMHKRSVMQEWMLMEWEGIQDALSNAVEDVVLAFHLTSHADELANICVAWRRKVQCIPCAWSVVDSWGPSDEVLLRATHEQVQPSFQDEDDQSVGPVDEDDEGDLDCGEIGDDELMDVIEVIALVDEYRGKAESEGLGFSSYAAPLT